MTLARQLRLLFIGLAVLVFLAVWLSGIWSSRRVLEAELAAQVRESAQALADRVGDDLADVDRAVLLRVLDEAVGLQTLRSVRLWMPGEMSPLERSASPRAVATPAWFTMLFPVAGPEVAVPVRTDGGRVGRLTARADPGPAAERLWNAALGAILPGAATALVVLWLGLLVVGPLTRPLRQAEAEAEAALAWEVIEDTEGSASAAMPATQAAVRQLSRRARLLLDGAQGLAATLHQRASRDPLTGLASRRRLLDVLEARRRDPEQAWTGGLLIVHLEGLKGINETFGYAAGDDVLRECAALLEETFGSEAGAVLAHLAGGEFAVLVPCPRAELLTQRAAVAAGALAALESRLRFPSSLAAFVGSAFFHGQGISALFAEADRSLRDAQWQTIPGVSRGAAVPPEAPDDDTAGRREAALTALRHGGLRLVLQPVVARETRELLHQEAYARIHAKDGSEASPIAELVSGGDPAVVVEVDRSAIAEALRLLVEGQVSGDLALNLSPASIRDPGLGEWLEARCREQPVAAARLIIELPDAGIPPVLAQLGSLLARLRRAGLRLAVDHFGAGPASFSHLRTLAPAYLKIDGSFAARLDHDLEAQFFVRATAQIAHGLGIPAYLEAVETEAVWTLLTDLQLDGAQGYHLGRPR